ncbi:hypothetical protein MTO96_051384 [Rhipicephalus appendiculatus]
MAQVEARRLSRELGLPRRFPASRGWLHRFMKRQELSIRLRTTICQRLPASYEEKLLKYQRYVIGLKKQHDYIFSQIGNADETPVYSEMPLDTTIEKTGSSSVSLLTGGEHETAQHSLSLCPRRRHKTATVRHPENNMDGTEDDLVYNSEDCGSSDSSSESSDNQ